MMAASDKSELANSKEYRSFRSSIPKKRVILQPTDAPTGKAASRNTPEEKTWTLYDHGPRSVRCPLVCLPPVSGTADVFFNQVVCLGAEGYRVLSIDYPVFWTHEEFCQGLLQLLDHLQVDQVHLFGASLGGFLAQKFAEFTSNAQRVKSLVLCNAFTDTAFFKGMPPPSMLRYMPAFMLRRMVLENYPDGEVDLEVARSVDFMVEQLAAVTRPQVASRLVLNTAPGYVEPQKVLCQEIAVMVIDVMDECAVTSEVSQEVRKFYPEAKVAPLKRGGNFPYLSSSDDINLYLRVHLRQFRNTRFAACESEQQQQQQ
eukprot:m.190309 g.190309  ORF g.190309 m.190309 type:complete len:315 (-) comp18225_c1_seq1:63-1007(-)